MQKGMQRILERLKYVMTDPYVTGYQKADGAKVLSAFFMGKSLLLQKMS